MSIAMKEEQFVRDLYFHTCFECGDLFRKESLGHAYYARGVRIKGKSYPSDLSFGELKCESTCESCYWKYWL